MSQTFRPQTFIKAKTEQEVSQLLERFGSRSKIIAGGTGIYEVAHRGLLSDVHTLIDISNLDLSYILVERTHLAIGSCTSMTDIMESDQIRQYTQLAAIVDALKSIQPLQVKNVATIGGAVCAALPFFDLPVALIAVDATVVISPTRRKIKLHEFIQGYFSLDLQPGEFVRELQIPIIMRNEALVASSFQKFALTADDWALVNCGVQLKANPSGKILSARVCIGGGVGEKVRRAEQIEKKLADITVDDETEFKSIFQATSFDELEFVSDIRGSATYRRHLATVLGRRAVIQAGKRVVKLNGGC